LHWPKPPAGECGRSRPLLARANLILILIAPHSPFVYVPDMWFRLRRGAFVLMLCLGLSGCSPTAETQMDEQKNPHYQAGKEKLVVEPSGAATTAALRSGAVDPPRPVALVVSGGNVDPALLEQEGSG